MCTVFVGRDCLSVLEGMFPYDTEFFPFPIASHRSREDSASKILCFFHFFPIYIPIELITLGQGLPPSSGL